MPDPEEPSHAFIPEPDDTDPEEIQEETDTPAPIDQSIFAPIETPGTTDDSPVRRVQLDLTGTIDEAEQFEAKDGPFVPDPTRFVPIDIPLTEPVSLDLAGTVEEAEKFTRENPRLRRNKLGDPFTPDPMASLLPTPELFRFSIHEAEEPDKFVVTMQSNPTEFEDGLDSEWARFSPPGGSNEHMHFNNTRNYTVDMELYFRASHEQELFDSTHARNLLSSWCYPQRVQGHSIAPPRLIAIWPNCFSIECYLTSLRIRNLRFAPNGACTRWVARIKLEQTSETWLTANDYRESIKSLNSKGIVF